MNFGNIISNVKRIYVTFCIAKKHKRSQKVTTDVKNLNIRRVNVLIYIPAAQRRELKRLLTISIKVTEQRKNISQSDQSSLFTNPWKYSVSLIWAGNQQVITRRSASWRLNHLITNMWATNVLPTPRPVWTGRSWSDAVSAGDHYICQADGSQTGSTRLLPRRPLKHLVPLRRNMDVSESF